MAAPDLSQTMRATILASSAVTDELPAYRGSYPVFTRVPVPGDVDTPEILRPMIVLPTEIPGGNGDGLSDNRVTVERDVNVYGLNDTAAHSRQVDRVAQAVWDLFHRKRGSISISGWTTVDVVATTPTAAPVDDEQTTGRRVSVQVLLARRT